MQFLARCHEPRYLETALTPGVEKIFCPFLGGVHPRQPKPPNPRKKPDSRAKKKKKCDMHFVHHPWPDPRKKKFSSKTHFHLHCEYTTVTKSIFFLGATRATATLIYRATRATLALPALPSCPATRATRCTWSTVNIYPLEIRVR